MDQMNVRIRFGLSTGSGQFENKNLEQMEEKDYARVSAINVFPKSFANVAEAQSTADELRDAFDFVAVVQNQNQRGVYFTVTNSAGVNRAQYTSALEAAKKARQS